MTDHHTVTPVLWSLAAGLLVAIGLVDALTEAVDWSLMDFAAAALLLFGGLALYGWLAKVTRRRAVLALCVAAAVATVWVLLATDIV